MFSKGYKYGHHPDYFLMAIVAILVVFGLAMLASASSNLGKIKFNDSYYYIKYQIYHGLVAGGIGFFLAYFLNYRRLKTFAIPLMLLGIVALAMVFTGFGVTSGGATRWLALGPISFQPSEIIKLTFIIYLAAWLSNPRMKREMSLGEGLIPFLIISGFIAALLFMQPATSTVAIILGAAVIMYIYSGTSVKNILAVLFLGTVAFALIIGSTPYRRNRILGYFRSETDSLGQNYQINQALNAIGSGGITGVGYGDSIIKTSRLPAPLDDSIFAVIAEELGFVGAGSLVVLFALLTFRMFWLARKMRDRFGQLILVGFGTIVTSQAIVNMGAISGMMPLTGIPLPFISFGGTALAVFLTMMGISVNISKYT
ncbi:MAG: putative peptidoglycan glycosyltransferase FtsW [Patescibacteria group bacterium]